MTATYLDLAGRSAVVTGAARGIGLAIATALVEAGVNTLLLDVDAGEVERAREQLATVHPAVVVDAVAASVTDGDQIRDALDEFITRTGSLDIVVNNAGVAANEPSIDLHIDTWQRAIDINLTGVFVCAQAAARVMNRQGGGTIINVASMYGLTSAPERAAYCASKAGVASLTKTLAVEWAGAGIRVNAVAPGYVQTELIADLAANGRLDIGALTRRTPRGRLASGSDISNLVLFLASDVAANITGQVVVSDGGWTADGFGLVTA